MPLILPNSIENDTPADAAELQQNFSTIQSYVNTNLVNRDGSVALTAPLLLPGDPTLPNQAANKGYVDGVDATKVAKAGDTMTGPLIIQDAARVGTRALYPTQALFSHKDASTAVEACGFGAGSDGTVQAVAGVDKRFLVYTTATGPAYTARMVVDSGGVDVTGTIVATSTISSSSYLSGSRCLVANAPVAGNDATRKDYVDARDELRVPKAGGVMTGSLEVQAYVYAADGYPAHNNKGVVLRNDGHIHSAVNTGTVSSLPNLFLTRGGGAPNDVGGRFAHFYSGTTGIGSITIGPASNQTAFNETSDYRLKDDLGPITDAVERLGQLRPIHIRWKNNGEETDGFFAHEVAEVVPAAVTGEKDAMLPADDMTDPGGIDPQQLDTGKLIPLLVAAVQQLTARVAELEAAA